MLEAKKVTELLREKGFKVTPQRLAVYDVLSRTKAHPNAETIYNKLQPNYPTMSLATVYKTLDILSEIGLVQVLNVARRVSAMMRTQKAIPMCIVYSAAGSMISLMWMIRSSWSA